MKSIMLRIVNKDKRIIDRFVLQDVESIAIAKASQIDWFDANSACVNFDMDEIMPYPRKQLHTYYLTVHLNAPYPYGTSAKTTLYYTSDCRAVIEVE